MKTIAEINYRGYVPIGWIACKICSINFSGVNSSIYKNYCREIEYEQFNRYNPQCKELEKKIEELCAEIDNKWRWYYNFKKSIKIKEKEELVDKLSSELKEKKGLLLKDETLLFCQYERYLEENGFMKTHHSRGGGQLGYDIYLYEKNNI